MYSFEAYKRLEKIFSFDAEFDSLDLYLKNRTFNNTCKGKGTFSESTHNNSLTGHVYNLFASCWHYILKIILFHAESLPLPLYSLLIVLNIKWMVYISTSSDITVNWYFISCNICHYLWLFCTWIHFKVYAWAGSKKNKTTNFKKLQMPLTSF